MLVDMLVGDETQGVRWSFSSRAKGRGQVQRKSTGGRICRRLMVAPGSWSELRIRLGARSDEFDRVVRQFPSDGASRMIVENSLVGSSKSNGTEHPISLSTQDSCCRGRPRRKEGKLTLRRQVGGGLGNDLCGQGPVGGLSFHDASGLCTNSSAHRLPGEIQEQGREKAVGTSHGLLLWGAGQLPVIRAPWVALSVASTVDPT